ncbi:MAG: transcriptional repressor [Gammaproteobacteria bacterium]|nr:transcriptional repressor [Gammaproteobacteria bacterium]
MDAANVTTRADRKRIADLLETHGIHPTAQRSRIAEVLFAREQHLTAEQVILLLGKDGIRVSKATVYNTLNLFAGKGLLKALSIDRERSMFDSNTQPHHHFHIEGTGELIDVPPGAIEFARLPALPPGTEPVGVEVVIRVRRRS